MAQRFHRYRPHPWHGLEIGPHPPGVVTAFVEITPFDAIKYEVDKPSGYLKVDRPQRTSALPPTLYGFVPRTYCGPRLAALMEGAARGDGDQLDICIVSERAVDRAEVILAARVIGGIPLLDGDEADDKIVAVLENDAVWSSVRELAELPAPFVQRLRHYFATYKTFPDEPPRVRVGAPYDRSHAERVIRAAAADYGAEFGGDAPSF